MTIQETLKEGGIVLGEFALLLFIIIIILYVLRFANILLLPGLKIVFRDAFIISLVLLIVYAIIRFISNNFFHKTTEKLQIYEINDGMKNIDREDSDDDDTVENFYFELTPEKYCDGGPYMYSSSPWKQKLCSKFTAKDLAKYNCSYGDANNTGRMLYHGRPIWRSRATNGTLSNIDWKNESCDKLSPLEDSQVL